MTNVFHFNTLTFIVQNSNVIHFLSPGVSTAHDKHHKSNESQLFLIILNLLNKLKHAVFTVSFLSTTAPQIRHEFQFGSLRSFRISTLSL